MTITNEVNNTMDTVISKINAMLYNPRTHSNYYRMVITDTYNGIEVHSAVYSSVRYAYKVSARYAKKHNGNTLNATIHTINAFNTETNVFSYDLYRDNDGIVPIQVYAPLISTTYRVYVYSIDSHLTKDYHHDVCYSLDRARESAATGIALIRGISDVSKYRADIDIIHKYNSEVKYQYTARITTQRSYTNYYTSCYSHHLVCEHGEYRGITTRMSGSINDVTLDASLDYSGYATLNYVANSGKFKYDDTPTMYDTFLSLSHIQKLIG
jgi:hypothetical protein